MKRQNKPGCDNDKGRMPDGLEVLQFGLFEGYWCCGPAQVNAGRSALAKQLAALAACMWLFSSGGPASAEEITPKEDTATDQAQEQWTFALPKRRESKLPWDDTYVSREGLVLIDVMDANKGCKIKLRRPYDGIDQQRDAYLDTQRFSGYDLHEQMMGRAGRHIRLDFGTLLNGNCDLGRFF